MFCMFVFILASTGMVISEHRPINVVSPPGIGPGALRFQDNLEAHNAMRLPMQPNHSSFLFFEFSLIALHVQIFFTVIVQ